MPDYSIQTNHKDKTHSHKNTRANCPWIFPQAHKDNGHSSNCHCSQNTAHTPAFLTPGRQEDGTIRSNVGADSVVTIANLKALDPASVSNSYFVFGRGFDTAHDGGGDLFYMRAEVQLNSPFHILDGITFNSKHSGSWHRHFVGPIHTSYVDKPTSTPGSFDSEGITAETGMIDYVEIKYRERVLDFTARS